LRVLGIDPGSRFLGYGVIDERLGKLRHVGHGVVKPDPKAPLEVRLVEIFEILSTVVSTFHPDAVAVEGVFTFKNVRSALVLGQARGAALLAVARQGLTVKEYAPAKVKKAVGANGSSQKDAVARMVRTILSLPELERHDAYDALAIAICHCNHTRFSSSPLSRKKSLVSFEDRLVPNYVKSRVKR